MKNIINKSAVTWLMLLLVGCASDVMKAPCDNHGHYCGPKIKINQW